MDLQTQDDRGFILVVVLAICVLLALVSAVVSRAVQSYVREAAGTTFSAQAEFAADAGVRIATLGLAAERDAGQTRRFAIDGTPWACRTEDGVELVMSVQEAGGKVNLNLADERLLMALFIGLDASPTAASTYADRILDFRDRDDDRRLNGAERAEYTAAAATLGPKNASFESREELYQVLGLDHRMIDAIWPYLTLYSGTAGLDPGTTSKDLVSIVTKGDAQLLQQESSSAGESRIPAEFVIPSLHRFFEMIVAARLPGGAVFVREAGFEIPSAKGALPVFQFWNRARTSEEREWPPIEGLPPC